MEIEEEIRQQAGKKKRRYKRKERSRGRKRKFRKIQNGKRENEEAIKGREGIRKTDKR